jgi:hypothetical protein
MKIEDVELSPKEHTLDELEMVIRTGLRAFVEVGEALLEIRDRRLYRELGFATFETYCRERWQWGRHYVNRQIAAAEVVRNLVPMGTKPETERQARALTQLPPEQQLEAWATAVAQSPNGHPTAAEVETVVKRDFFAGAHPADSQSDQEPRQIAEMMEPLESAIAATPIAEQPAETQGRILSLQEGKRKQEVQKAKADQEADGDIVRNRKNLVNQYQPQGPQGESQIEFLERLCVQVLRNLDHAAAIAKNRAVSKTYRRQRSRQALEKGLKDVLAEVTERLNWVRAELSITPGHSVTRREIAAGQSEVQTERIN